MEAGVLGDEPPEPAERNRVLHCHQPHGVEAELVDRLGNEALQIVVRRVVGTIAENLDEPFRARLTENNTGVDDRLACDHSLPDALCQRCGIVERSAR